MERGELPTSSLSFAHLHHNITHSPYIPHPNLEAPQTPTLLHTNTTSFTHPQGTLTLCVTLCHPHSSTHSMLLNQHLPTRTHMHSCMQSALTYTDIYRMRCPHSNQWGLSVDHECDIVCFLVQKKSYIERREGEEEDGERGERSMTNLGF